VAEQLLNGAQVCSAVEEMRGERVPQTVRVRNDPAERAGVEPAAACREEDGVVRAFRQLGPSVAQVPAEPQRSLLAERHDAILSALAAANMHVLLLEVHVTEIEADRFGAAEAGGVHELDERAVPERDRTVSLERLEHALDLGSGGGVGQTASAARREPGVGNAFRTERVPKECAYRGQLAADRGRGELPAASCAAEPGHVVGEDADVDRVESRITLLEPRAELVDVAAVGATGALAQRRRGEEAVGGGTSVHSRRFPGYRPFPFR